MKIRALLILGIFLLCHFGWPVHAQVSLGTAQNRAVPVSPAKPIPQHLKSPRKTVEAFFAAMDGMKDGDETQLGRAVSTLDLSDISPLVRAEVGRDLVWILIEVLDRGGAPDVGRIPTKLAGDTYVLKTHAEGQIALVFKGLYGSLY